MPQLGDRTIPLRHAPRLTDNAHHPKRDPAAREQPTTRSGRPTVGCGRDRFALSFHEDPSEIERSWRSLEPDAICTVHQSYVWASAWCRTAAAPMGERPLIVFGTDPAGQPAFILPMALVKLAGLQFATWLSQSHSAYNIGIFRHDIADAIDAPMLGEIFVAMKQARPELRGLRLTGQPERWEGRQNPFTRIRGEPRPSCYEVPLKSDFGAVCASHLSPNRRRHLKRQQRRLTKNFDVAVTVAERFDDREFLVRTFMDQKGKQIVAAGMPNLIVHPPILRFYQELAASDDERSQFCAAGLLADRACVATMIGLRHKDRYYDVNGSMADTRSRRWSIGVLLMANIMERQCRRGTRIWDFGPGETEYKAAWRPAEIAMFDTHVALEWPARVPIEIARSVTSMRWQMARWPLLRKAAQWSRSALLSVARSARAAARRVRLVRAQAYWLLCVAPEETARSLMLL